MILRPVSDATLEVLQGNVALLAEKERLEGERQRLLDLDRLRTEFLARVSHDLRTPLASIIGFSELLIGDGAALDVRQRECLEAINRNGHALLAMITDLLDLSTLESGQLRLHPERVALVDLIRDLRAATAPVMEAAGVTVGWPSPDAAATAWCDRRRLLQALTNLLDNARKFTPRGGAVLVAVETAADATRITVADSGPGIPESERERLFRAYAGGTGRASGHGLGLAIVRAVVERHGGAIGLDSAPGRGCAITVIIPDPAPQEPAP